MSQAGYTPIQLYYSSTASNAPSAGNLAYGELAINITDGKLYYKDNANAVQVIGWKTVPATAGGTGQTSYAVGDLLYADTTTSLAKLADVATGNALISGGVGVAPSYGKIGLTTHISGVLPVANGGTNLSSYAVGDLIYASGTTTLASLADVATGNALISGGVGVAPSWGKVGLTTHVSGTLPVANGGTNLTSFTANGIMYASSTSALATGSALTFDGTNFATTGSASATRFIPTGSTVATNGMFLPAANTLAFSTNSTEVFRLDSSQRTNFGGTSFSSNFKFTTTFSGDSTNGFAITNTASSGGPAFLSLGDTAQALNNTQDCAVYGDTGATRWVFKKNGGLWNYQANNLNLSDRREKTNFAPAKDYLDILCSIPVQTFNYIDQPADDAGLTLGVIAQDVAQVAPEFVTEGNWGTKDNPKIRMSIYETDLKYAMLKALQELNAKFDAYVASHP